MSQILLINTRPAPQKPLLLEGVDILALPLLQIHHVNHLQSHEEALMIDFIHGRFAVVVVVSVEAVRGAMQALARLGVAVHDIKAMPVMVAVGTTTRRALEGAGFCAISPTQENNEGMLAMPAICQLTQGQKVLIWRGVGGRRLLHDTLVDKGVDVSAIAFYERITSPTLMQDFNRLHDMIERYAYVLVLITSQASLEAWHNLGYHRKNLVFLTLGERLTHLATTYFQDARVELIDKLDTCTLTHTIDKLSVNLCKI